MSRNEKGQFEPDHGMYDHPLYPIWRAMIGRCTNKNNHAYKDYGGRGISVCKEWYSPKTFIKWLENNNYGDGLQLDRIDNDGPYSPVNCRIVTRSKNCRNRRDNRRYMVHGELLLTCEVEEKYGVKAATFRARVESYGQTPEEALINRRKMPVYEWEIDGVMMSTQDVQNKFGVRKSTFNSRLRNGWNANRAAKTPIRRCVCPS